MDNELLGYLLRLDDADDRARVERELLTDPELARRLTLLTKALLPLEADREAPTPPRDLVVRTVGRVAQEMVEAGQAPVEIPDGRPVSEALARLSPARLRTLIEVMDRGAATPSRVRRPDAIIAGALLLLALGLILGAVPYWRHRQNVVACQNRLRDFHGALMTYGDLHGGRFPQVGEDPQYRTASSFLPLLREAGVLPVTGSLGCPSVADTAATYAYSLGYRDLEGHLCGLRREADTPTNDLLPILADRPPPSRIGVGPDHGNGQNVLYVGGHVAFCTSARVGVNGDDIYRNQYGEIGAGLHRWDTVLGVGNDVP